MANNKWTSTAVKNPEQDGFYLATIDGEVCGSDTPVTTISEYRDGVWLDGEEQEDPVIAWMPMPEPYVAK